MSRDDLMEMFERIPDGMHAQVNLVLRNTFVLSVDAVARFEETYVVFRGREGGTSDEGRAFFVPYDEISYIRLERVVRLGELKQMFGETGFMDMEDRLEAETQAFEAAKGGKSGEGPMPATAPAVPATPIIASDPASIARQNLLDRIRAARANVAGTTGKLGSGGK